MTGVQTCALPISQNTATGANPEDNFALLDEFDDTADFTHEVDIDNDNYAEFEDGESSQAPWTVVCLSDDGIYAQEDFLLGYDTTAANIEVGAFPNPVQDPSDLTTVLTVSTDDATSCTYLDKNGIPTGFPGYNINDVDSYDDTHQVEIEYFAIEAGTYTQTISCRNTAGWISTQNYDITVDPSSDISIDFTSSNITNENTHLVRWETSRAAICSYRTKGGVNFQEADNTNAIQHNHELVSDDGLVFFEVYCEAGDEVGYDFTRIRVDTTQPALEVYLQDPVCTSNELVFVAATDGTGTPIVERIATVTGELGVELVNESFSSLQHTLTLPETGLALQQLGVTVRDGAGNERTVVRDIPIGEACDLEVPSRSLSVEPAFGGFELTVECEDDNCAQSYAYTQITCDELQTELNLYNAQPLLQTEGGNFCYWVYDTAGNLGVPGSEIIEDIPDQCTNGIEDPDEEGQDCGGPCAASCTTCNNGIEDDYEEGVDCGGVCSAVCEDAEFTPIDEGYFNETGDFGFDLDNGTFVPVDEVFEDANGTEVFIDEDGDLVFIDEDGNEQPILDDAYFDEDGNLGFLDEDGNFIPIDEGYINEDGFFIPLEDEEYDGFFVDDDGNLVPIISDGNETENLDQTSESEDGVQELSGCETDMDCAQGEFCSSQGECRVRRDPEEPVVPEPKSPLGWFFIGGGILLIGSGVYYIIYSQKKKEQARQLAARRAQQQKLAKEQQEKMKARKDKIDALHKKQDEQNKTRSENLNKRKAERKSLIEQFAVDGKKKETPKKSTDTKPTEKKPKDGDDYKHVEELHKDAAKKQQKGAFEALGSLIETGDVDSKSAKKKSKKKTAKKSTKKKTSTSSKKTSKKTAKKSSKKSSKKTSKKSAKKTSLDELDKLNEEAEK